MSDAERMIEEIWRERVDGCYVYRGMARDALCDPLDPRKTPFASEKPLIRQVLGILRRLVDAGFEFTLLEEHWGNVYRHDLRNIIAWSLNDLDHPRLDFTSRYRSAREYSDNWQGSQLKQNLRYISMHLPDEHREDPVLKTMMTESDWEVLQTIRAWTDEGNGPHVGVVLWLRRSHPGLETASRCTPVGTLTDFRERLLAEIAERHLDVSRSMIEGLLPGEDEEFYAHLRTPLPLADLAAVEDVDGPAQQ